MLIWGITSGAAGMNAQVDGVGQALAETLGAQYERKTFIRSWPLGLLPGNWTLGCRQALQPPFPDAVISCGRRSVAFALTLKKLAGCRLIHLQDPRISPKHFDFVVSQEHDGLRGENILTTFAAMHAITHEKLAKAAQEFAQFEAVQNPRVAVLVGGNTNRYKASEAAQDTMVARIANISGSVMLTTSRRTPKALVEKLKAQKPAYFYDGIGPTPYLGLLAHANEIYVTNDSVSMLSEAAYTQKPLHVLAWQGHEHTVPARFAEALIHKLEYGPLPDERAQIVAKLARLLVKL